MKVGHVVTNQCIMNWLSLILSVYLTILFNVLLMLHKLHRKVILIINPRKDPLERKFLFTYRMVHFYHCALMLYSNAQYIRYGIFTRVH